ncbi:MAG: hypothetical protein ACKO01_00085, partial [Erythrobacter sp.]
MATMGSLAEWQALFGSEAKLPRCLRDHDALAPILASRLFVANRRHPGEGRDSERHALHHEALCPGL